MKTAIAIAIAATAVSLMAGEIYAEEGGEEDGVVYDCSKAPAIRHSELGQASAQMLIPDCEILLSIKDTLSESWNLNWDVNTDIAKRKYIDIDIDGVGRGRDSITGLVLKNPDASDPIPIRISELTSLRTLNLDSGFAGEIPPEIGELSELEHLSIRSPGVTGSIPPELGNLSKLKSLAFHGSKLSGELPFSLGFLLNLETFYIHDTDITGGLPISFVFLYNMRIGLAPIKGIGTERQPVLGCHTWSGIPGNVSLRNHAAVYFLTFCGLEQRISALEDANTALETRNQTLEARLTALEERLVALESSAIPPSTLDAQQGSTISGAYSGER